MKNLFVCAVIIFISLKSPSIFGQIPNVPIWESWIKRQESDVLRKREHVHLLEFLKQDTWSFLLQASFLLNNDAIDNEIGITSAMRNKIMNTVYDDVVVRDIMSKMKKLEDPTDPYFELMSESEKNEYLELMKQNNDRWFEVINEAIGRYLAPEQIKRTQEIQIMFMASSWPIHNPEMFKALGISEKQELELEDIRQKLESDFEDYRYSYVETLKSFEDMTLDKIKKMKFENDAEFLRFEDAFGKEFAKSLEFQQLLQKGRVITAKLHSEVSGILTDEQLKKMNALIDNPPDKIKECIKIVDDKLCPCPSPVLPTKNSEPNIQIGQN